jgi:hypothetical protein
MARRIIDIGIEGNDGTGDSIRESFRKANENFQELYAVFGQGGRIEFTDLDDTPDSLQGKQNAIAIVDPFGSAIDLKRLEGLGGVVIDASGNTIKIASTISRMEDDPAPKLSFDLNARTRMIGNLKNPDNISVAEFNSTYGTTLTIDDFAITKGYADNRFVNVSGDVMTGPLSVPAGASGNQVPRTSEVITRGGSTANRTMNAPLFLSDHPGELSGLGTPNGPDDLQSATKFYVDQSSFSTTINLFVTTQGDDDQTLTPSGKEGRSRSYSFATIGKACERAEELLREAALEPGPYRQPITYNDANKVSFVTNTTTGTSGTTRIFFRNNSGSPVDQGRSGDIDIIPGKLIAGRKSGATGIVFVYYGPDGSTDSDFFDLTRVSGTFQIGEELEFDSPVKDLNITIFIESGIYYEDFPIRIPPNTALVGDEMRRTIIRPNDRISRSRWVEQWFFRNKTFDGLTIATTGTLEDTEYDGWYGYHYLQDPSKELNTLIYNINLRYPNSAKLIEDNKSLIQDEIVLYINDAYPALVYNQSLLSKEVGVIVDSIVSDLRTGSIDEVINSGEQYWNDENSSVAITTRKSETLDGIDYVNTLIQQIITNTSIANKRSSIAQVTGASGEAGSSTRIISQIETIQAIIEKDNPSSLYNPPKNNRDLDAFLCADSTIIRQVCVQGHGGFMMVFDPEGQILSKSPYCQQSSSFSASANRQAFRGGQYADGFVGNLPSTIENKINNFTLIITDIPREPQVPTSFFIDGERYKINDFFPAGNGFEDAAALLSANKSFLQEQVIGYINSTYPTLNYKEGKCRRDIGYVIDAMIFDFIYGGNLKSREAAKKYYTGAVVHLPGGQKAPTIDCYEYLKTTIALVLINQDVPLTQNVFTQLKNLIDPPEGGSLTKAPQLIDIVIDVIDQGLDALPAMDYAKFKLIIDSSTPLTISPASVKLLTAGNTSMLSNDYTQINDLGYGLIGNNTALLEAVSVFTYYCHTGYYSKNGAQIRSLTGNNSYGTFGLIADGSDPLEVPDPVFLADNMVQVAKAYKQGNLSTFNKEDDLAIYISDFTFLPYSTTEVEINHGYGILKTISLGAITGGSGYTNGTYNNVPLTGGSGAGAEARVSISSGSVSSVVITKSGFGYAAGDILSADTANLGNVGGGLSIPVADVFNEGITRYEISNIEDVSDAEMQPPGTIIRLNISTAGNNDTSTFGLRTFLDHEQPIILRSNQNFKFNDVFEISPTRPSTALTFKADPDTSDEPIYRVIAYGSRDSLGGSLAADEAVLTLDSTYDYVRLVVDLNNLTNPDPLDPTKTLGSLIGDNRIAIERLTDSNERTRIETGEMIIGWEGRVHRVTDYEEESSYAIITLSELGVDSAQLPDVTGSLTPGISQSLDPTINRRLPNDSPVVLRAGLSAGELAEIVVRISTCRATSHDFLDIGTGGYNSSNYPNKIYGAPPTKIQSNEVQERARGRVFYASTDQDGFFRIGRFFTVDQGTGRVTFSASIALTNLDGIGFKRGVTVAEFSNDDTFTQPANDTVPTELAIHGYLNRRLGLVSESGTSAPPSSVALIDRVGPGFMDLLGINSALNNLNMGGFRLVNVGTPGSDTDAANKLYVDTGVSSVNELRKLNDTLITSLLVNDMLIYNGTRWINARPSGDVLFTISGNNLVGAIANDSIVNADVKSDAGILQSKLSLNPASTRANATGISQADLGVSSFNSNEFSSTNGWIEVRTSSSASTGIPISKIQFIDANTILGNVGSTAAAPQQVTSGQVVTAGDGIKNASFTSLGAMTVSGLTPKTYTVTPISTTAANNSLVRSNNVGDIDVRGVKIDGYPALDVNLASIELKTPGGVTFLSAAGDSLNPVASVGELRGSITVFGSISTSGASTNITAVGEVRGADGKFTSSVVTPLLTTGSAVTAGTVVGNWSLGSGSRFQATYADLAEYYEGDREYEPGTVLVFGGDKEVTTTNIFGDRRIAGVVSETAAYIMNKDCPGIKVCLALQGRVKVKILGQVKKGDMIVSSAKAGFAIVNNDPKPGTIIGKAIENKEDHFEGIVEVAIGRL